MDRKTEFLDIGAKLAGKYGAVNVTRRMVAQAAKVSDGLVAHYLGSIADAQKLFAKHAKKLGIEQPAKDKIESIGTKMRAHGPRKEKVVRSKKATRAPKETKPVKPKVKPTVAPKSKPARAPKETKPVAVPETKVAAPKRKPAMPVLPALPSGLPPIE